MELFDTIKPEFENAPESVSPPFLYWTIPAYSDGAFYFIDNLKKINTQLGV